MSIRDIIEQEMKKGLVQKQIFCPITQEVLDVRTAQFALDQNGDPGVAFAPGVTEEQIADWMAGR